MTLTLEPSARTAAAVDLNRAPLNTSLVVASCCLAESTQLRLRTLGIRPGAQVSVVQKVAGGGRIVSVAGTRVALGRPVLAGLLAHLA